MVFWVVVWMQDANGNLVAEMQDHGLTSVPSPTSTQITQVPVEAHSNNVGMYPVHQPFFISPAGAPGASETAAGNGVLQSLALAVGPQAGLNQPIKVVATVQASTAPVNSVNISYYDGDPALNGTLFDMQTITHMDPGAAYYHRSFFVPSTCGTHTLYAKAWLSGLPGIGSNATTAVTLNTADYVQALINATQSANITDAALLSNLLAFLHNAQTDFQQGRTNDANHFLAAYMQQIGIGGSNGTSASTAGLLTGQAAVILSCGSKGFSLATSPSIPTVPVGTPASFTLAVIPTGGFTGAVSFSCSGAPAGVSCSFSPQSTTLDGSSQATVMVTVNGSAASTAGIGVLPKGAAPWRWVVMLLLTAFAIVLLQRARVRHSVLGCLIALVLLGAFTGCGASNGATNGMAPGQYSFTLQATSGNVSQNTLLIFNVK
jgi:hypothetical protein